MKETIEVSAEFNIPAEVLFTAWMTSEQHSAMTGGTAQIEFHEGGAHSAWDEYITGTTIKLEPYRRIIQSWRSSEFPEGSEDSVVEIVFRESGGKTTVNITHSNIPEGQGESYKKGWVDHYFNPMKNFFKTR